MPKSTTSKTKKPARKLIAIYAEEELAGWLSSEAKREDRPVSQLARILVKEAKAARELVGTAK